MYRIPILTSRIETLEEIDGRGVQTYTPTTSGFSLGTGGSTSGAYVVRNGWCVGYAKVLMGTTAPTVSTGATLSVPVTAATGQVATSVGISTGYDATSGLQHGTSILISTTTIESRWAVTSASAVLSQISSTVPITWAANDYLTCAFSYQVA